VGRICRKKGFKSGMKERVGDEKLIISVAVRGINDHIRFYTVSQKTRHQTLAHNFTKY